MSYWDSSALLKLTVMEADSADFQTLPSPTDQIATSMIARFEIKASLHRCEAEGVIPPGEAKALGADFDRDVDDGQYELNEISAEVQLEFEKVLEPCYTQSPPVRIRTNDAIHLATAMVAKEQEFVSADLRQRTAARLLGLTVLP